MSTGYTFGLDLGQAADFSALCVLERSDRPAAAGAPPAPSQYAVVALKRWPLGTSYPAIVKDVAALLARPQLKGAALVVDASGVGRPVVDLLRQAELPGQLVPVVITAGQAESKGEDGYHHVAKVVLVSATQVLLQQRRLKFAAGLSETKLLVRELENYRVKITAAANEIFDARDREHDDLVLALALACWWGERHGGPWEVEHSDPRASAYARTPKEAGYHEFTRACGPASAYDDPEADDDDAIRWPSSW